MNASRFSDLAVKLEDHSAPEVPRPNADAIDTRHTRSASYVGVGIWKRCQMFTGNCGEWRTSDLVAAPGSCPIYDRFFIMWIHELLQRKAKLGDRPRSACRRNRTGRRRWWFVCPVTGERVEKLYLPLDAAHFAGRKAHDLTYTSCQQSGREKRLWRRVDKLLGRKDQRATVQNCR